MELKRRIDAELLAWKVSPSRKTSAPPIAFATRQNGTISEKKLFWISMKRRKILSSKRFRLEVLRECGEGRRRSLAGSWFDGC